jgi:C_GCAxxG_C_C family probable redox protein
MGGIGDMAEAMFNEGFNCAQSVLACCGSRWGLPRETGLRVAQAFGGGMCHLGQTCGAVTGALMVIGLKYAKIGPDNAPRQKATEIAQELARQFTARNGSVNCSALLGCDLGTPDGVRRFKADGLREKVCAKVVRDAAEIVDRLMEC